MNSRLRAVHVEDEPLCRDDLRSALRAFPDVSLIGEADHLAQARQLIEEVRPDLLFLDLSLGREKGFDLLQQLHHSPVIIAITAHAEKAVDGFALDLVDFVLKPVEIDRLRLALDRARRRIVSASLEPKKPIFLPEIAGKKSFLSAEEIFLVQAEGNYVIVHSAQGKGILRSPFHQAEEKLPPAFFVKVSRSCIVAINQIQGWSRDPKHALFLDLKNGKKIPVARRYTKKVLSSITQSPPP